MMTDNKRLNPNDEEFVFFNEATVDPERSEIKILTHNTKKGTVPTVTIEATLQTGGELNWNNKIYPTAWLAESLDTNPMIQNDIRRKQWIGEYGHPLGEGLSTPEEKAMRQAMVHPQFASHRVDKYWWIGDTLKGQVTSLPSGFGINFRDNTLNDFPASFSYRGMGKFNKRTREVLRGLISCYYDYVFRPSDKKAYEDAIIALNEAATHSAMLMLNGDADASEVISLSEAASAISELLLKESEDVKRVSDLLETANGYLTHDLEGYYVQGEGTTILVPLGDKVRKNLTNILKG